MYYFIFCYITIVIIILLSITGDLSHKHNQCVRSCEIYHPNLFELDLGVVKDELMCCELFM